MSTESVDFHGRCPSLRRQEHHVHRHHAARRLRRDRPARSAGRRRRDLGRPGAGAGHTAAGRRGAAGGAGRRLRRRRGPRRPAHAVRRAVPAGGPPAPRRPARPRGPSPAALRPGRRPGVRRRRARRLPGGLVRRRSGRHRLRARGSPAQRGLRLLPGLRDLPAPAAGQRPLNHLPPAPSRPCAEIRRTEREVPMSRDTALVSAPWGGDHLDDPKVVLVEGDEDTAAYDKGHIKGAIKLDWTTDLQDQVRRDFVDKAQFEALLSSRGVANDSTVVLYGGNNNWFAAYAYWYFKLYGHQDVKLLDGGRKKWELDSRELTDEPPSREATSYTAQQQDRSIRAFRDEVVAAIGAQNLVDVRSPDEYAGRLLAPAHLPQEQAQRAGHIPTAANVPWSKAANDDGTFRSDDELREIYTEAGVDWDKDTIAYCRIGERSSHTWFVLKELLGQDNVKNYDGSWTEYGSLVGVPVVLGDEAGEAEGVNA